MIFLVLVVIVPVTAVIGVALGFLPPLCLHAMDVRLERWRLIAVCHGGGWGPVAGNERIAKSQRVKRPEEGVISCSKKHERVCLRRTDDNYVDWRGDCELVSSIHPS